MGPLEPTPRNLEIHVDRHTVLVSFMEPPLELQLQFFPTFDYSVDDTLVPIPCEYFEKLKNRVLKDRWKTIKNYKLGKNELNYENNK